MLRRLLVVLALGLSVAGSAVAAVEPAPPSSGDSAPASTTGAAATAVTAVGSAFTYQGMLKSGGGLAQGNHDFVFRLYDDAAAGTQIGSDQTLLSVPVQNGFFTVALDFGAGAFDGNARWLAISVRQGGGGYTALLPRQALLAAPYATRAINGPSGASQWTNDGSGISYAGSIGIGTTASTNFKEWIANGAANSNALYVSSNNPAYAALFVRNAASNGPGIWDDTSGRHYLSGHLGLGTGNAEYPLDIVNSFGSGARIFSTGTLLSSGYPGEGVRAALFVHGLTGGGAFGTTSGGIYSSSTDARAVSGWSVNDWGVDGNNTTSGCYGVLGTLNEGVFGWSPNTTKPAGRFSAATGGVAIEANGLVKAKTLQILGGADLAEPFDVAHAGSVAAEPGAVVVIDEARPGSMKVSHREYDTRVAGVISGAHGLAPGMVLKSEDAEHGGGDHPVALTGRVWCKVDASFGAVRPGDLLTTSPTAGHAMVARDAGRRSGATIGKAMTSLESGRGLVLVLVSLQ